MTLDKTILEETMKNLSFLKSSFEASMPDTYWIDGADDGADYCDKHVKEAIKHIIDDKTKYADLGENDVSIGRGYGSHETDTSTCCATCHTGLLCSPAYKEPLSELLECDNIVQVLPEIVNSDYSEDDLLEICKKFRGGISVCSLPIIELHEIHGKGSGWSDINTSYWSLKTGELSKDNALYGMISKQLGKHPVNKLALIINSFEDTMSDTYWISGAENGDEGDDYCGDHIVEAVQEVIRDLPEGGDIAPDDITIGKGYGAHEAEDCAHCSICSAPLKCSPQTKEDLSELLSCDRLEDILPSLVNSGYSDNDIFDIAIKFKDDIDTFSAQLESLYSEFCTSSVPWSSVNSAYWEARNKTLPEDNPIYEKVFLEVNGCVTPEM